MTCTDPRKPDLGTPFADHIAAMRRQLRDIIESFGARCPVYDHTEPELCTGFLLWPDQPNNYLWTLTATFYLLDIPCSVTIHAKGNVRDGRVKVWHQVAFTRSESPILTQRRGWGLTKPQKRARRRYQALWRVIGRTFSPMQSPYFNACDVAPFRSVDPAERRLAVTSIIGSTLARGRTGEACALATPRCSGGVAKQD